MRYKIRVILDNDNDEDVFKDFEVSKNINLTKFHEYIKKEFNLQGSEMASFYSVDENWDTLIEYTLVPFDDNSVPMEKLSLHDILNNNESSILYVYDFMNMWTFFIELLNETSKKKNESQISLFFSKGEVPKIPPKKNFSNDQKEHLFATSVIAISAKLAKSDGKISKSEILAFKKIFEFPAEDEKAISNIFNSAKENIDDYKDIAEQVYIVFKSDKGLLFELLNSLFSIAYADGELHPKEKVMLSDIAKVFQISGNEFEILNNIFEAKVASDKNSINRSYKILGLSENASLEQVSNQYRKLIKEYHPDKLQGMGLPKEFIELANQKLSAINKAYTEIKNNEKKSKL